MSGPGDSEILYIADPMCSWCWGFSPVISKLRAEFDETVPMRLVLGGLRVGTTQPMTPELSESIVNHWREVKLRTGQEFKFDFDLPDGFLYDTEAACRATVAVRELNPEATFPYFESLHRAFYVHNRDITDDAVLAVIAEPYDVPPERFFETFESKDTRRKTMDDIVLAANLGIRGFPAIVLRNGEDYALLTLGYEDYDNLAPGLAEWIANRSGSR